MLSDGIEQIYELLRDIKCKKIERYESLSLDLIDNSSI